MHRSGRGLRHLGGSGRRLREQILGRVLSELQNPVRQNAEVQCCKNTHRQGGREAERNGSDRDLLARFAHVHHNDDPEIVVSADRAVDDTNQREPDEVRTESGAEYVELGEEAAGDRNSDQRQQKNR